MKGLRYSDSDSSRSLRNREDRRGELSARRGNERDRIRSVTYSQGNRTRNVNRDAGGLDVEEKKREEEKKEEKKREEKEEEGNGVTLRRSDVRGSEGGSADWSEQDESGSHFDMMSGGTNFASVGVNYTVSFIIQLYGKSSHVTSYHTLSH